MTFRPQKDGWLGALIWGTVLLMVVLCMFIFANDEVGVAGNLIFLVITCAVNAFLLWFWYGTYYVVQEKHLVIRSGPIKKRIPFEAITKVHPVKSVMSSAALSASRLEILYNRYDIVHISPQNQDELIRLLRERCPTARVEG